MAKRKSIDELIDEADDGDVIIVEPVVVEEDADAVVVEVDAPVTALVDQVSWASNTLKQIARGAEPPVVPPVLETLLPVDASEGQQVLLMDWRSFRIYAVKSKAGWQVQPVLKQ